MELQSQDMLVGNSAPTPLKFSRLRSSSKVSVQTTSFGMKKHHGVMSAPQVHSCVEQRQVKF